MAEDKKNVAGEVEQATTDTKKAAAAKVAKAAKGSKTKEKKPNIFVRAGKAIKRFFKDFRGESKKIVWPDGKTVMKNTGIVILVVAVVALVVMGIDNLLAFIIKSLQNLATGSAETTAAVTTAAANAATTAGTTAGTTAATTAASGLIGFFSTLVG